MAGTLITSTLQGTTLTDGTNSTSTTNCIQGSAKAWVNFNGTGTVAIRASYNVSSITDDGTGQYTINFTTAFANTNYSTIGSGYPASSGSPAFTNATRVITAFSNTSSSCRIQICRSDTNSFDVDSTEMNVAVFSS
jgi:hypothetical protein